LVGETPFPFEFPLERPLDPPLAKLDPRENEDCGKLSSEEAYLGDVGPAPVPGLNAPEERRLVSGFMSNGL